MAVLLEPGIARLIDLGCRSSGTAASRSGRFVYIKTYFIVLLLVEVEDSDTSLRGAILVIDN
jgi:hypothetical protein